MATNIAVVLVMSVAFSKWQHAKAPNCRIPVCRCEEFDQTHITAREQRDRFIAQDDHNANCR